MTKIKTITIHGFKSFAHRTDIPFDNKFNCILGPNGSGKSNVADALCFVLGRLSAKSLRAEKAANLIFNGGKKKTPAKAGTVEVVFDNSNRIFPLEVPEVTISRTIAKDSTSKYRINGKRHTRTEILDLLGAAKINPEGHNIVLQGDITRFVEMPPLERRKIIEEISDVTVYEEKKHKALLELNKVEEKLNNAAIILKERGVYLKELKKDRDQALKFKEFKDKIDSNKATYLYLQMEEKRKAKEKYDQETEKFATKNKKAEAEMEKRKEKIKINKEKAAEINKKIEEKGEKEQLKVHRQIEDLKVTLTKDKARISTLKDEINKIQQRKDQFNEEIKEIENKTTSNTEKQTELKKKIESRKKELTELENKISLFKKKNKIESSQELDQEIEAKDKLIEEKQEEVQKIRQQQQELLRQKDKIELQLESIDEKINKVKEVEKENKEQIKELQEKKKNFKESTLRLNQLLDQDSSFAAQLGNAKKSLAGLEEKQAQLNAKTKFLQAGLAHNQAVQALRKQKGVYGTVAELGQANKKYSLPLEIAAGSRMEHVVVDDDKTAADCIKYLKEKKLGRASFIPLNKIKYQEITAEDNKLLKEKGVHDFALNLISYKPQYKKAFQYVFGNSLVVEDIDIAREVGIGKIRMVTLDGNLAEGSGVMKGGFLQRKAALGFQEKDSLEQLEQMEKEIAQQQGVISNVLTKREANEQEIESLRKLKAELEAEVIKLEKSLHLDSTDLNATVEAKKELQNRLATVEKELSSIQKNITLINKELADLKSKKQILRGQMSELHNPRLLAQLSAYEESKQQAREDLLKAETELKNAGEQMEQLVAPEKVKILDILKQHQKEEEQFGKEIEQLSQKAEEKEKELAQKEEESKQFYSQYKELFNQREKLSTEINSAENEIENIREKSRASEREINLISLKNAEIKAKLAGLEEEFSKYEKVEILKNKNAEELKEEINKFEVMLAQMSAVNLKALEIYEQIETEFNKLIEKKESLEKEKTEVLTLMNEIETKKKEHFTKTFDKINENFQRIFESLFKKGKAYLQLDNPDNPFEEGLSVKVKITGNRYMDIKSLSGGEKALTALSFIFAIQEHQPASFYILDEIDAALDKQNSETLSKLIRNYADKAQYILISHNDALISEADTLFGVSMNEGISKVTSLKI